MAETYARGSEWRKWDLHIHSPLSILHNNFPRREGKPDWQAYLAQVEPLDLSVIGVTDYFSIEGYKILLNYRKERQLKRIKLLLPNIEFRLSNVLSGNFLETFRALTALADKWQTHPRFCLPV